MTTREKRGREEREREREREGWKRIRTGEGEYIRSCHLGLVRLRTATPQAVDAVHNGPSDKC
jgi:hypothetical protein